ncbi:MAG TPA: protein kinase [Polyangiaceae bacterium]|nr:protein kinase [Polyangiaceae bacterium]
MRNRDKILTEFREFQDGELIAGTRYRVVRLIGVGGMGSVYEVEHVELGKRFVLKALLRELARREDLVARLRNEWRALARLQHANIVNVTDAGTSGGGVPFYVMERLDGDTLAVRLKQKRRLHVLEAVAIAAQVLEALSAAHDIGIIHRDVKPANIFLVAGGGVRLLDFGIAKIADATSVVTARGIAVGTPRYMSPEQARGERVDGRSDVYATGLILFEMIAGMGPYDDARDANELLLAHLAREAPPLSALVMGVSPALERILVSMLAKDCRERPPHARVVAEQLREFADRYPQLPATDAPTAQANYGAPTVLAAKSANWGPKHELPTRPDGPARSPSTPDLSRSDTALTQPLAGRYTTQVTLTVNTGEALSTSSAPNTTYVSAPSFDGSTTLEMATLVPAYATPPAFGMNSALGPGHPPVERPERTEMLGEFTPAMPADAVLTRTHVPLVDVARPNSVTPPPVVDAGRTPVGLAPRPPRAGRLALLAATGLALLVGTGLAARRGLNPSVHAATAVSAPLAVTLAAPPTSLPAPIASPPAQILAPALAAAQAPGPLGGGALTAAPSAPANVRNASVVPGAKRPSPEPAGAFLRAAAASSVAASAPKPKAKHPVSALPASGL